jgi:hypothetical protein
VALDGTDFFASEKISCPLLAYLLHAVLDWMDAAYRAARGLLPSRRTFFEPLRALLQYLPFDSWAHLMEFILKGLGAEIPDSGVGD